jgi:hypothetical protein
VRSRLFTMGLRGIALPRATDAPMLSASG